jgi:hypothetical protein
MNPFTILVNLLFYAYAVYLHDWKLLLLFVAFDILFFFVDNLLD